MLYRLSAIVISALLMANVVGCCARILGRDNAASAGSAPSVSSSAPEASSSAPESAPISPAPESSAPASASESEAAPSAEPLPEILTLEYLFSLSDSDSVEIYSTESGKRFTASASAATDNIGKLGVGELKRVDIAAPASPDGSEYLSVTSGDIAFYIFKGESYGLLETPEQSACYELPSGLYSKIQFALMFM